MSDSAAAVGARIESFAPVLGDAPRILILGSMPGAASLAAQQYYAHPHNAFWKIMTALLDLPADATYDARIDAVKRNGIALWDVLHSCVRPGSLDAAIESQSVRANDIAGLLARHPGITRICFNGAAAEKLYRQHVAAHLAHRSLDTLRLPSSSPAHATMRPEHKLERWRAALALAAQAHDNPQSLHIHTPL
jgi:hypoxanthine-DNA glycosylase